MLLSLDPGMHYLGVAWWDPTAGERTEHMLLGWETLCIRESDLQMPPGIAALEALIAQHQLAVGEVACEWLRSQGAHPTPKLDKRITVLRDWAQTRGYHWSAYPPFEWRAAIVGHASATKQETVATIRWRFPQLRTVELTDHAADAIGVGEYHLLRQRQEQILGQQEVRLLPRKRWVRRDRPLVRVRFL